MICLKIRTFVVSATTNELRPQLRGQLWFAWKFVPLWYQQQHSVTFTLHWIGCDLLENSYLCGISNNEEKPEEFDQYVVICLKIRTFVVSATTLLKYPNCGNWLWFAWKFVPLWYQQQPTVTKWRTKSGCDLLENSYLCGISNNTEEAAWPNAPVVICLKIRTFVVSATTHTFLAVFDIALWFAWKFVPLWYQQQPSKYLE